MISLLCALMKKFKWPHVIVAAVLGLIAAWLSFRCNEAGAGFGAVILQIIYTIVAFLLGGIYIIYYLIVHWIGNAVLGNAGFVSSCPKDQKKIL